MDYTKQQKEQDKYFTGPGQDSANLRNNYYDFKSGQNLFLPTQQKSGYDTDFACSCDFDRNMGLQVVPSFDDEVFADSAFFSHIYYEHKGVHQNQSDTNYQSEENRGKLCESLSCLPEEDGVGKDERTDSSGSDIKTGEGAIVGPERRRQSDTDSLDVYLKPCVITPTKVEDLYSTLEGEDNIIFQFPPDKKSPTCQGSSVRAIQENETLNDSNVFQIQLCSLSHHEDLDIESSNDRNLNLYHSNDFFEQKSYCSSTTNMKLSHQLASRHSAEPESRKKDSPINIRSVVSNSAEFQESCDYSDTSSSFPPFLVDLSSQRIFPPKPTQGNPNNIRQNVPNESIISLDFELDKKEYLHMENKDPSGDKKDRKSFVSRETIEEENNATVNVFQKTSDTIAHAIQNQKRTIATVSEEEQAKPRKFDSQYFKPLSSKTEKESCINTLSSKSNYRETEMSSEVEKTVIKGQPLRDTRMNHNDTEKQRRVQMKSRFESLRQVVPRINKLEKTPKIQILKQAWKYIRYLEDEGRALEFIRSTEKEQNQNLLKKLQNIVKILKENPQAI